VRIPLGGPAEGPPRPRHGGGRLDALESYTACFGGLKPTDLAQSGVSRDDSERDRDPVGEMTPPAPSPREFVGPGAVVGLAAWAVGLVLTVGLGIGLSAAGLLDVDGTTSTLAVGAWLFLDAHLAPVAVVGGSAANVVVDATGVFSVFALVPALALLAGSAVAVGRVGVPGPVEGAKAGAALVLGYVAPTVVALLLLDGTVAVDDVEYALAPDPGVGLFVAGVVYPLVVGAVGGAVAGR